MSCNWNANLSQACACSDCQADHIASKTITNAFWARVEYPLNAAHVETRADYLKALNTGDDITELPEGYNTLPKRQGMRLALYGYKRLLRGIGYHQKIGEYSALRERDILVQDAWNHYDAQRGKAL